MRWGDGAWKIIRVLEVPVVERRRSAGKSADASPRQRHVPPRRRSDRKCFQEKPLSIKRKAGVKNTLFSKEFIENVPESIIESGIIADSSIENFKDMFARIKDESSIEKMIKVQKENNSYWFEVKIKSIYDENNKIINTVGVVDDITDIKLQEELLEVGNKEKLELKKRAERDGLTGLYNVAALNTKVSEVLNHRNQNPGPHLFVLIDLDNFKEINDNFGHQYGDKVLTEVAQILQNMFRRDDIVARLGGDEFVVFLVNAASYEVMKPLFQRLCDKQILL